MLEKDVRYLDSRIALLIQNRMALEEVCHTCSGTIREINPVSSKMKSQVILKMQRIYKRASSPTMTRPRNPATFFSSFNPSLDISPISAD